MNSKIVKIIGWIISGALGALFLMSAFSKLTASEEVVAMMANTGFADDLMLLGIGEALAVILFLIPKTTSFGILVFSGYIGGAIAVHMGAGESYLLQSVLLVAAWLGAFLREPRVLASFMPKPSTEA